MTYLWKFSFFDLYMSPMNLYDQMILMNEWSRFTSYKCANLLFSWVPYLMITYVDTVVKNIYQNWDPVATKYQGAKIAKLVDRVGRVSISGRCRSGRPGRSAVLCSPSTVFSASTRPPRNRRTLTTWNLWWMVGSGVWVWSEKDWPDLHQRPRGWSPRRASQRDRRCRHPVARLQGIYPVLPLLRRKIAGTVRPTF